MTAEDSAGGIEGLLASPDARKVFVALLLVLCLLGARPSVTTCLRFGKYLNLQMLTKAGCRLPPLLDTKKEGRPDPLSRSLRSWENNSLFAGTDSYTVLSVYVQHSARTQTLESSTRFLCAATRWHCTPGHGGVHDRER